MITVRLSLNRGELEIKSKNLILITRGTGRNNKQDYETNRGFAVVLSLQRSGIRSLIKFFSDLC